VLAGRKQIRIHSRVVKNHAVFWKALLQQFLSNEVRNCQEESSPLLQASLIFQVLPVAEGTAFDDADPSPWRRSRGT